MQRHEMMTAMTELGLKGMAGDRASEAACQRPDRNGFGK
jgi:hypothetical protein